MNKTICNVICLFIRSKEKRHEFRKKHCKEKFDYFDLKNHINYSNQEIINRYFNLFFNAADCKQATSLLRETQLMNFFLLRKLREICDKLNINIWLHGGTLLGAVRHNGFVPWDDDIDIGIMRKDYDKLYNYLKNDELFVIRYFYLSGGRAVRFMFNDKNIPCFVDLFTYDECACENTDEETLKWEEHKKISTKMKDELFSFVEYIKEYKTFRFIEDLNKKKEFDAIVNSFLQKKIDLYNEDKREKNCIIWSLENWDTRFQRLFRKDFIFPFAQIKYEGLMWNVPKEYEKYLTKQYGDYMKLSLDAGIQKHGILSKEDLLYIEDFFTKNNLIKDWL